MPDFLGHPRGLWYLAFTEAWERFSYYGMQALLVLYMVKYLLLPGRIEHVVAFEGFRRLPLYGGLEGQALASAIFGTYSASVYLTPIFGGFLADRILGRRRTVLLGALTMAAGHFLMAFEGAFLFALLCLVLGCGMFKGNIASQVGSLYRPNDLRRADAFQIFYLGINAGVIASPLIVGTLGEVYGWHYGFAAAGVGMLLATGIYLSGQKYLPAGEITTRTTAATAPRAKLTGRDWRAIIALILLIPVLAVAIVPN
ncbi:MAG: oligopeptide:H+ symporter, partial [Spartobacteria bacterium]